MSLIFCTGFTYAQNPRTKAQKLQWFTDTPQLNLDIFKEGKTKMSVCTILHQWEKGDMKKEYGVFFKVPHKIILLFPAYDAPLVSQ